MIKRILLFIATLAVPALLVTAPVVAQPADIQDNLCAGANLDVNSSCSSGGITDLQARERINRLVRSVVNIFSWIVGIVAVIMIIIGGLKYITSGGDSSNVTGAKNTILYAIIGIIIVAFSQFIVRYVLNVLNNT